MEQQNLVTQEESPRSHFTMIPNIVDDSELDPYSFRLYVHLRRVAGEAGECWQSTTTLAEACKMSAGKVSECKAILNDAGLIIIRERRGSGRPYHNIIITDIWARNAAHFNSVHQVKANGESVHQVKAERSPGETKKNPIKKNPIKEEPISAASAAAPPEPSPEERAPRKKPKTPIPKAVQVFRENAHRYPAKAWYTEVDKAVGEKPDDLKRWGALVLEWVGRGYNPVNVAGMLDAFSNGGLKGDKNANRNTGRQARKTGSTMRESSDPEHDREVARQVLARQPARRDGQVLQPPA